MVDMNDDDHLFEDMNQESPGTIRKNIIRKLGLASQVAEAIRSIITQDSLIITYLMLRYPQYIAMSYSKHVKQRCT